MRLLNANTLQLVEFVSDIPPYAILSHTWGPEEVTFQDMQSPERDRKKGFAKVVGCCRQARLDTIEWVWIDTCCIDKTSSTELSEAINSMYAWYRDSQICYAYLEDVPPERGDGSFPWHEFKRARWFTRGWCLQELIAPATVEFYAADWSELGTKSSLCDKIEARTGIPRAVLLDRNLGACSVAQKMSWASQRSTSREEDEAYCLLGIFNVNMPLLYGEGKRAFLRLQEEIIKQTEDYSFLLWTLDPNSHLVLNNIPSPVFADSPSYFARRGPRVSKGKYLDYDKINPFPQSAELTARMPSKLNAWVPPQMTSRGLRTRLLRTRVRSHSPAVDDYRGAYLIWSGCTYLKRYVCILLDRAGTGPWGLYARAGRGLSSLYLLDAGQIESFELSELYLYTRETREMFSPGDMTPDLSIQLEILITSSWDRTVTFIETLPDNNGVFDLTCHDPRGESGLTQVLRTNIVLANKADVERDFCMKVRFEVNPRVGRFLPHDVMGHPFAAAAVLESRRSRLTCAIQLDERGVGISRSLPDADRARIDLPDGAAIVASAKSLIIKNGRPSCVRLLLRLAVLPRPRCPHCGGSSHV